MAAVAPPADQAADLLQTLSLDSQAKTIEIPDATKKPSVDSANIANGIQLDRSVTPLIPDFMDPTVCYLPNGYPPAYYYGGFEGKEWEDYSRYVNPEGVELTPGAYGDNGSLMYHHIGYTPNGPYSSAASPIPTLGHDGQLYGPQHYQYPTAYFQSMPPISGPYPSPAATGKGETVASDQAPLPKSNGSATKGNNGSVMSRPTYQNSSINANGSYGRGPGGVPASGYQDPRFAFDGLHSPIPWIETPYMDAQPRLITSSSMTSTVGNGNGVPLSKNQNYRPHNMGLNNTRSMPTMNTSDGYMNRMYPNKLYGQFGNTYRSSVYGSTGYDVQAGGRGWVAVDSKYKPRGRGNGFYSYGSETMDGLNELNRGPRTQSTKNLKGFTPVALAVKGQNNIPLAEKAENEKSIVIPDREQYNRPAFPETYPDANFFIIKSYSEDDVHKSIKYNIWASTPNGNKKLDAAYQSAQQKPGRCSVFLFFSVNTSGQFVGVAEMVGPVDFNKNVDYWQQDKWIGCFPVKWHIVKDVPNSLLKHITLENNENKPVTNSRDTQEVNLEEGLQVLKIFKDHISKQCILDDFDFYEDRQKKILEKKAKQQYFHKQTQVCEGKPTEEKNKDSKENGNADSKSHNEVEKETAAAVVANDNTLVTENNEETLKTAAIPEQKVVVNGVANGC